MANYYENMENACRERDLTLSTVMRALGKNRSNVGSWKGGSIPSIEICDQIAKYLGISIDFLVNGEVPENYKDTYLERKAQARQLTREEQEWLNLFHQIPEGKRYAFKTFLLQMIPESTPGIDEEKGDTEKLSVS